MPEYHFATWEQYNYIDEETGAPEDFDVNRFHSSIEESDTRTIEDIVENLIKPDLHLPPGVPPGDEAIVLVISRRKKMVQRTLAQFFDGLDPDLAEDIEEDDTWEGDED